MVVFGENARQLDLSVLPQGLLLDAVAAQILEVRGVDVGLCVAEALSEPVSALTFLREGERTPMDRANGLMQLALKPGATVWAEFSGAQAHPAVAQYENADGLRVVLLAIDADAAKSNARFQRNYCLPKLLGELLAWAGRTPLPATCFGHPDLYLLVKRDEKQLSVGMWNLFADEVLCPTVTLDQAYRAIETINGEATVKDNIVQFSTDIPAFGFAGFTVSL